MKFPSFSQWKQIFKILKKGEKITLSILFVLLAGSLAFLSIHFYLTNTVTAPGFGGSYTEGIVGQPRFINPVYGETNDIDRSLIDLVYSGLMTYDKDGNIVNDLAQSYEISQDGKTYTFNLKPSTFWHDGRPLTASDVIFTVKTIQNSDYKSPLRANWIDVGVEKISDSSVAFHLKRPYNSFLENCTLKIIPEHIWENILPENFALSFYNLQPIGSGPFKFTSLSQNNTGFIEILKLASNRRYYNRPSYLATLTFKFFEKTQDAINAANQRTIQGFTLGSLDKTKSDIDKELKQGWAKNEKFSLYSFSLPRYFAVFFNNQKTSLFADSNIRKALTYAVNKPELLQTVIKNTQLNVSTVNSPILPDFYGLQEPTTLFGFDTQKANELLDKAGFKKNAEGHREKVTTKKPAFQFKNYLKVGSKGSEVTQLQACLSHLPKGKYAELLKDETNGTYGKGTENAITEFQKEYLPDSKSTGETGAGTRAKLNELCAPSASNSQLLSFTLVTINQPQLLQVADVLKKYWEAVGVTVQIDAVNITDLKPIIKNRSYDALLYGETLGMGSDLYPFWYSSQKQDPGLNLSSYENKDLDKLLQDARETQDPDRKSKDLEKIQNIIINDAAALFLYNPDYLYWVSQSVQGVQNAKIADPAKRFVDITNWYTQTKRAWK